MKGTMEGAGGIHQATTNGERLASLLSAAIAERLGCEAAAIATPALVWRNESVWSPTSEESQGCLIRWEAGYEPYYWWFSREAANVVVDRVLGGNGAIDRIRPLTDVDRRLTASFVADVVQLMTTQLGQLGLCEPQAELCDEASGSCEEVLINATPVAEITAGGQLHAVRFSLCLGLIETETAWLLSPAMAARFQTGSVENAGNSVSENTIQVVLGEIDLPSTEVAELEIGDTIVLETDVNQPLTAILQNEAFLVDPGSFQGRKAIRIRESDVDQPDQRRD